MSRQSLTLLLASVLVPFAAGAQPADASGVASPATPRAGASAPSTTLGPDADPVLREVVRREVEKAKEEMREEIRAEIQGAQAAREFTDATAGGERGKLDFLQLNGYLRLRGDLFDNLDLRRPADPSGYYLFPRPISQPDQRGTLTSANMRFRLEPTFNVSEQVRVLAQIDMLDNLVFGSTPANVYTSTGAQFQYGPTTQLPPTAGVNSDRNSINVKRAWAEVQTPVGLLSFGRMPSSWGLGILSHAGNGFDDDLGDSVDRIQFAVTPLSTPLGPIVLVPTYEIVASGISSVTSTYGRGLGQPFDRDQLDDAKAYGVKVISIDTDEAIKRRIDKGQAATSFGLWYQYKTQGYVWPIWATGPVGSFSSSNESTNSPVGNAVKRDAWAHVVDFWFRRLTKTFRLETELAWIYGEIGNSSNDPATNTGPVLLRQLGGTVQTEWKLARNKLSLGGEFGFASGDSNYGFGNQPGRTAATVRGDIEGQQFRCDPVGSPGRVCDSVLDIRNFRFNPAYRVDLILWREILQGLTDAWYLKPTLRYEVLDGLTLNVAVIYSQAMNASSTPSTVHSPLGIELDVGATYKSDDGFIAFLNYGLLQPLDGFLLPPGSSVGVSLSRGHAIRTGVGVRF